MKKTSLLLITLLTSSGAVLAADPTVFEESFGVPPHVTDVTRAVVLNFTFSQAASGTKLCDAIVNVYPDHLDVIFHTCAEGVRKGWGEEAAVLDQLRRLINETRSDLIETPIKDYIYRK
jgi:hypothetical protein